MSTTARTSWWALIPTAGAGPVSAQDSVSTQDSLISPQDSLLTRDSVRAPNGLNPQDSLNAGDNQPIARCDTTNSVDRVIAVVLYALIAVVGLVPEVGDWFNLKAIQVEAILLILLVLLAHGLVWRFMTIDPPAGRHEAMSPPEGPGRTSHE